MLKAPTEGARIVVEAGDLARSAPLRTLCEGSPRALARLGKIALVKADGSFDRSGIMKAAAQAADAHQLRFGCSRREALSVALKAAWQSAHTTRRRVAH